MTLGVGFLGCGPVAQAIHVPSIRNFPAQLWLAGFMDVDADLAHRLAAQHDGFATTDEDALIADDRVDIVVVGSPNAHHARQIIKACNAGKRAVLAEKPLAVNHQELAAIKAAALASGTRIIMGAMHSFDQAFLNALTAWRALGERPTSIEVTAFIDANEDEVDCATQLLLPAPSPAATAPAGPPPEVASITAGILGLATHDIPLVREFLPTAPTLIAARRSRPRGYALQGVADGCSVSYLGLFPGQWMPHWSLRVVSPSSVLDIEFQVSYVLASSCIARLTANGVATTWHAEESSYVSEWRQLLDEVVGANALYSLDRIGDDLSYALSLIEQLPSVLLER